MYAARSPHGGPAATGSSSQHPLLARPSEARRTPGTGAGSASELLHPMYMRELAAGGLPADWAALEQEVARMQDIVTGVGPSRHFIHRMTGRPERTWGEGGDVGGASAADFALAMERAVTTAVTAQRTAAEELRAPAPAPVPEEKPREENPAPEAEGAQPEADAAEEELADQGAHAADAAGGSAVPAAEADTGRRVVTRAGSALRRELESLRGTTSSPPMTRPRQRQRTEASPSGQAAGAAPSAEAAAVQPDAPAAQPFAPISADDLMRALGSVAPGGAMAEAPGEDAAMLDVITGEPVPIGESIDPDFLNALEPEALTNVLRSTPAANETAPPAGAAPEAEGGPSNDGAGPSADDQMEGIDPEFLAALPPELQAEVLEQQRRERRLREAAARREQERAAADAAAAAGPSSAANEGDLASMIGAFPQEIREEILLG